EPGVSAVEVDPSAIAAFVHGTTGIPTSGGAGAPPAASSGPTGNAAITVDVTNAPGQTGLARDLLAARAATGFVKGEAGNGTHRTSSVLFFPSGGEADAQAVQAALGGDFVLEEGPSVPRGHVWVYLGLNFHSASNAAAMLVPHPKMATDIA